MGQFSVEKPVLPGSVLSGNQHLLLLRQAPLAGIAALAPGKLGSLDVMWLRHERISACHHGHY
jgi:hypothetical protein